MNLLQTAAVHLAAQLKAFASQEVIVRDGGQSIAVDATLGSAPLRVTDGHGQTRIVRPDRDFILTAADLVFGGELRKPSAGWKIDATLEGVTQRYEVMALAPGEPAWRWCDSTKVMLRVHTKLWGAV